MRARGLGYPPTMAEPVLLHEREGAIARLVLNRPDQFNALSDELVDALTAAVAELHTDDQTRVVVIAAAGRAFSAGHDLREMRGRADEEYYADLFGRCGRMMEALVALPQPVVAEVQGVATAAGCQLVASCDLAVAGASARFATSGINLGLFCSTPSVALSRNVATKHAFELLFTGDFIDAETAARMGLVNRVVPDAELADSVRALAAKIAAKPAAALRSGKALFYRQLHQPLDAAYRLAGDTMAHDLLHADAIEGIDAFLEKRDPTWKRD